MGQATCDGIWIVWGFDRTIVICRSTTSGTLSFDMFLEVFGSPLRFLRSACEPVEAAYLDTAGDLSCISKSCNASTVGGSEYICIYIYRIHLGPNLGSTYEVQWVLICR